MARRAKSPWGGADIEIFHHVAFLGSRAVIRDWPLELVEVDGH